jgi:hypothetical protein
MAGYPLKDTSKYLDAYNWAKKVVDSHLHSLYTAADTIANVVNLRGVKLAYPISNGNPAYSNNGYAQLFVNMATNKYSTKESMWEADFYFQSITLSNGTYLGSQIGSSISGDPLFGNCSSSCNSQQYLYNLYGNGDLRRDWAISTYSTKLTNGNSIRTFYMGTLGTSASAQQLLSRPVGKWRREYEPLGNGYTSKPTWNTQINFPLLRYSDVLLMLCEAEYMINGATTTALDAINQVRRRAYGLDPNQSDVNTDLTSSTLTLNTIQDERARELCFESLRRPDLIRWGIYLQRMQEVINFNNTSAYPTGNRKNANRGCQNAITGGAKNLLWPIPSSEILVNSSMTQNPGY